MREVGQKDRVYGGFVIANIVQLHDINQGVMTPFLNSRINRNAGGSGGGKEKLMTVLLLFFLET